MYTMFQIERAEFVDSDISEDHPGYPLGHFRISIAGMAKRIYLDWSIPVGEMRPIGARRVRARSYKKEAELIKNLKPGNLVNLVVNMWDSNSKDARCGVFSLSSIEIA